MADGKQLKLEIQRVKRGTVSYFGFLKGAKKLHGLTVSRRKLTPALIKELQTESSSKRKPILGRVRFSAEEGIVIFETKVSRGPLLVLLKETFRVKKVSIGKFDVRKPAPSLREDEALPDVLEAESENLGGPDEPQPVNEEPIDRGQNVRFTQARLAWDMARKNAHDQMELLKAKVRAVCKGHEGYEEIVASFVTLDKFLERMDERLIDKLDAALNEPTLAGRQDRLREARALLGEYKAFLTDDPLAQRLDKQNGFLELTIQKNLLATVHLLENKI